MKVLLVTTSGAEARLDRELLGLPLGLRAILMAQDAGAHGLEVSGPAAATLLAYEHDARVKIPVTAFAATREERIVMQADTLVSPSLLRKISPGHGVLSDRNMLAAARKVFEPGDGPSTPLSGLPLVDYERTPAHWAIHVQNEADFAEAARLLLRSAAGPKDAEVLTKTFRRVSPVATKLFIRFNAPAWAVTTSALVVALMASQAFGSVGRWAALVGALLYALHAVLACADGEVARLTRQATPTGAIANRVANDAADGIVWMSLCLGVGRTTGDTWSYANAIFTTMLWTTAVALRYGAAYRRQARDLPDDPPSQSFATQWLTRDTLVLALILPAAADAMAPIAAILPAIAAGAVVRYAVAFRKTLPQ